MCFHGAMRSQVDEPAHVAGLGRWTLTLRPAGSRFSTRVNPLRGYGPSALDTGPVEPATQRRRGGDRAPRRPRAGPPRDRPARPRPSTDDREACAPGVPTREHLSSKSAMTQQWCVWTGTAAQQENETPTQEPISSSKPQTPGPHGDSTETLEAGRVGSSRSTSRQLRSLSRTHPGGLLCNPPVT